MLLDGWSGLEAKMSIKEINNLLCTKGEHAWPDHRWDVNGAVQHEGGETGAEL